MKKQLLNLSLIIVAVLFSLGLQAQKMEATITSQNAAPTIDGVADDDVWDACETHDLERIHTPDPADPTLTLATWKAFWNDTAVFVLVEVEDDDWWPSWLSEAADWESDKPEVYFDVNATLDDDGGAGTDGTGNGSGHYQLAPNFTNDTDTTAQGDLISIRAGQIGAATFTADPCEYAFEYSASFAGLTDGDGNALDPTSRTTIGFDVTVIDRDEGDAGRRRATWSNDGSTDECWNNMDDAGLLTFQVGTPVSEIAFDPSLVTPTIATTYVNVPANALSVTFYNTLGQAVKQVDVNGTKTISVADLGVGIYFVSVKDADNQVRVARISKK